jgi:hypothetical protein
MAQGAQSKALIIVSKAKGWDPTKIYDRATDTYSEDISNFDKSPEIYTNQAGTGQIPGGKPIGWPDTFGPPPIPSVGKDETDWSEPGQRDSVSRATRNSDPFAGMGGPGG